MSTNLFMNKKLTNLCDFYDIYVTDKTICVVWILCVQVSIKRGVSPDRVGTQGSSEEAQRSGEYTD